MSTKNPMTKTAKPAPKKAIKPNAKKVFDVAKPGKSSATATSRPIIITNHPTAPDPMVVTTAAPDLPPSAPLLPPAKKIVIKPLDDSELVTPVATTRAVSAPEVTVHVIKKSSAPSIEEVKQKAEAAAAKPVVTPPAAPAAEPKPPEAAKPDVTPPATSSAPATPTTPATAATSEPAKDDPQLAADQLDAAAKKAADEQTAAVKKLVAAETYFLPINHREKRRAKRFMFLGLLLIVALAVAWVDVALDAGLIANPQNLPHSHFFTAKATN